MATQVDAALQELNDALSVVGPQFEGFREIARLPLSAEANDAIQAEISFYNERAGLLDQARTALLALNADGYPDLPVRSVPQNVYDEIAALLAAERAAFTKLAPPDTAANLNLEAGAPQPK